MRKKVEISSNEWLESYYPMYNVMIPPQTIGMSIFVTTLVVNMHEGFDKWFHGTINMNNISKHFLIKTYRQTKLQKTYVKSTNLLLKNIWICINFIGEEKYFVSTCHMKETILKMESSELYVINESSCSNGILKVDMLMLSY